MKNVSCQNTENILEVQPELRSLTHRAVAQAGRELSAAGEVTQRVYFLRLRDAAGTERETGWENEEQRQHIISRLRQVATDMAADACLTVAEVWQTSAREDSDRARAGENIAVLTSARRFIVFGLEVAANMPGRAGFWVGGALIRLDATDRPFFGEIPFSPILCDGLEVNTGLPPLLLTDVGRTEKNKRDSA